MRYILQEIKQIKFGQLSLVAQDRKLVQVERFEKIRLKDGVPVKTGSAAGKVESSGERPSGRLEEVISREFAKLAYGRLNIIIQGGSVIQMEKTEQQRFTGLYGEGI